MDTAGITASALLEELERRRVRWCWYKGYDTWTAGLSGDIDLAVDPGDADEAVAAVSAVGRTLSMRAFVPCWHADVIACHLLREDGSAVEIDFNPRGWAWRGRTLLTAAEMIRRRRFDLGIWLPSPDHEALLLLCLYVFGTAGVDVRERAARLAIRRFLEDPTQVRMHIDRVIGCPRVAARIRQDLEAGRVQSLVRIAGAARRAGLFHALATPRCMPDLSRRFLQVYWRRRHALRCGLWMGPRRHLRPVRGCPPGAQLDAWLGKIIAAHPGAWG